MANLTIDLKLKGKMDFLPLQYMYKIYDQC